MKDCNNCFNRYCCEEYEISYKFFGFDKPNANKCKFYEYDEEK